MIRKFNTTKIIKFLILPLGLLIIYCGSFIFVYSEILDLPRGINFHFVLNLLNYSLIFFIISSFFLIIAWVFQKDNDDEFTFSREKIDSQNLILLLIPLTPIIRYILINKNILSILNISIIIIIIMLFSGIFIIVIPYFMNSISVSNLTMSLGTAFVFSLFSMPIISNTFSWNHYGNFLIQLAVLGIAFFICLGLLSINHWKFMLLIVLAYLLISNILVMDIDLHLQNSKEQTSKDKIISIINENKPKNLPNIYLLVYDAYVNNETMLSYGIDNADQETFLRDEGFVLYSNTYSIGAGTISTMSRVFNMSRDYYGDIRRGVSGDGVVHQVLRKIGYKTFGLFPYDYMFINTGSHYDFSIPKTKTKSHMLLISAILEGEFRFDIGFDEVPYGDFVENKRKIINEISNFPVFIYTHSRLPGHSQNSGVCRIDEIGIYKRNLHFANIEMKDDIAVINQKDPNSIVIIAGDHGPYLTKNCHDTDGIYDISKITRQDIQDRFGTFLAIRWPYNQHPNYDNDITVIQDLFPVILSYIFDDADFLDLKISPITEDLHTVSGAYVDSCIIHGGENDGELLFNTCK